MDNWVLTIAPANAKECVVTAEMFAALFEELGTLGWEESTPPQTDTPTLRVFFPASVSRTGTIRRIRKAAKALQAEGVLDETPRLSHEKVERYDWVAEFRKNFRGIRVGEGLRVVPPWRARATPSRPGDIEIVIEPGTAFGTGLHETTRLCLRLLQREIAGGERVIDIGAGSGILALGAVRLGARSAVAIEIDPQAHANLRANIRRNRLGRNVRVFAGGLSDYLAKRRRPDFETVICNMLPNRMQPLLASFAGLAHRNRPAMVIVSGHLVSEREEVSRDLAAAGIRIVSRRRLGDWSAFVGWINRARPSPQRRLGRGKS